MLYNITEEQRGEYIEVMSDFIDLVQKTKVDGLNAVGVIYDCYVQNFKKGWFRRKPMSVQKLLRKICTGEYLYLGSCEYSLTVSSPDFPITIDQKMVDKLLPGLPLHYIKMAIAAGECITYANINDSPVYRKAATLLSGLNTYHGTTRVTIEDHEFKCRVIEVAEAISEHCKLTGHYDEIQNSNA